MLLVVERGLHSSLTYDMEKTGSKNIIFNPKFMRESKALYDNVYPLKIASKMWGMTTGKVIKGAE